MRYDWYLFDLDGTLTESDEGIVNCAKHALSELGVAPPSDEDLKRFIGPPLLWSFRSVAGLSEADARRATELYRARYSEFGWRENRVYPGIAPLLKAIRKRGGHVALASAKPEVFCRKILDYFGLSPYFDRVCGISLTDSAPEKADIISRALPDGVDLARCVMVGDREYDIDGARAVGIKSVGVLYGYGTEKEFAGADFVAGTVADLSDYLVGERDRGYFITFEGGDGCGKSTQFTLARDHFARRGWDVVSSREPGGCEIAERIRALVLDASVDGMTAECEALLYAAARAQHVREVIRPAVAGGKLMLCDRFLDSSIAFQAYGRELTEPAVRQINALAVDNLSPDLTLLYILDAKTARERVLKGGAPDRIEREGDAFVARVRHGYETLANREPGRFVTIDAARGISDVFPDTARAISELIDQGS
jgi:dTMP kinase